LDVYVPDLLCSLHSFVSFVLWLCYYKHIRILILEATSTEYMSKDLYMFCVLCLPRTMVNKDIQIYPKRNSVM